MNKLLLTFALLVFSTYAIADFYTGNDLNNWSESVDKIKTGRGEVVDYQQDARLYGYVSGIHDVSDTYFVCTPSNVQLKQVVEVVKKFVKENPELWNKPASTLVVSALIKAFPCAKKN